ncbi:hypothetical protein RF55_13954 [Lasius niger]|uniref:Uncharacterized protein n=1 Tax=Lasius niger TaxID=67767 RepID=A0A0J7N2N3_LASNI|nr:hypothetical protein RF55_13954 [Lasius niger]
MQIQGRNTAPLLRDCRPDNQKQRTIHRCRKTPCLDVDLRIPPLRIQSFIRTRRLQGTDEPSCSPWTAVSGYRATLPHWSQSTDSYSSTPGLRRTILPYLGLLPQVTGRFTDSNPIDLRCSFRHVPIFLRLREELQTRGGILRGPNVPRGLPKSLPRHLPEVPRENHGSKTAGEAVFLE